MSALDVVVERLKAEEGFRSHAYRDTLGHLTIGYGFNIEAGISERCAASLMAAQIDEIQAQLNDYSWFNGLDAVRGSVLLDIAFNAGVGGLLHFPKMLAAIGARNWQGAHDELLDSQAARMLPTRYEPLAKLLLTGEI